MTAKARKRKAREVWLWLHYPGGERVCKSSASRDEGGVWWCSHNLIVRKYRQVLPAPKRKRGKK